MRRAGGILVCEAALHCLNLKICLLLPGLRQFWRYTGRDLKCPTYSGIKETDKYIFTRTGRCCAIILWFDTFRWTSNMVSQVIGLLKSFWSLFIFFLLLVLFFIYFFHRASGLAHRHLSTLGNLAMGISCEFLTVRFLPHGYLRLRDFL